MDSTEERRRYPRYDARVPGVLDGSRAFETLTIGAGGASIRIPEELPLEQPVQVQLALRGQTFTSPAVVIFVGPDLLAPETTSFRIGLAFTDTPPEEQARLLRFIETTLASRAR
jgi:hypothetical protein